MPKIKKEENDENQCPMAKISSKKQPKCRSVPFKFDVKKILKERKAYDKHCERSTELDKQLEVVDELFQKEVNRVLAHTNKEVPVIPKLGFVVFDSSKYNIIFKNNSNSDVTKSYLQRLYLMSIEENELQANIHFYNLMNSNWSPVFDDVQNIFINWGTDVDILLTKPLIKCPINDEAKIKHHSFVLVIQFIIHCIQKSNNNYSVKDLLTLAKFAATISLDHHLGQTKIIIKELFSTCVEAAFHDDKDTAILSFSQELFSKYKENQLSKMVVDLFLPLEGEIMKKTYTCLSFQLYQSYLGKTKSLSAIPSNMNDWFVQDLVNANYFCQNPKNIINGLIQLLEHIVVVLDLYENEEKVSKMYDFLYAIVKPVGLSVHSLKIVYILDHWRLHLFRLHVNRKKMLV